jgi:hypothetical protein
MKLPGKALWTFLGKIIADRAGFTVWLHAFPSLGADCQPKGGFKLMTLRADDGNV